MIAIALVVVVVGLVLVAVVWAVVSALKGSPSDVVAHSGPVPVAQDRLRPILMDFHVHDNTAVFHYDVPLSEGHVDEHLRAMLCHDAWLVLHEKRADGLPIAQVTRATVFGRRGDEAVQIGTREFEEPGVIPVIAAPELTPHAALVGYDPLAHLGEQEFDIQSGVAAREPRGEGLPPFLDEITIAKTVDARLRASGIDPTSVSLEDLALSLLKISGYEIVVERAGVSASGSGIAQVYTARKAGSDALVVIVSHAPGEHPELSELVVDTFVVAVAQRNPERALLITDKFSPYVVYQKERSDPRCRFITRERLQAFVDSFAIR